MFPGMKHSLDWTGLKVGRCLACFKVMRTPRELWIAGAAAAAHEEHGPESRQPAAEAGAAGDAGGLDSGQGALFRGVWGG